MAGSVNKVIIVGNLGKDPEVRRFPNGGQVVNFSVATSDSWRDKNTGERREKTEWHRVAIFNEGLCRIAEQYLRKGSKVYLEGQLQTREWEDKDGQKRYTTEVVLQGFNSNLTMLDGRSGNEGERGSFASAQSNESFGQASPMERSPASPGGGRMAAEIDDDIPF